MTIYTHACVRIKKCILSILQTLLSTADKNIIAVWMDFLVQTWYALQIIWANTGLRVSEATIHWFIQKYEQNRLGPSWKTCKQTLSKWTYNLWTGYDDTGEEATAEWAGSPLRPWSNIYAETWKVRRSHPLGAGHLCHLSLRWKKACWVRMWGWNPVPAPSPLLPSNIPFAFYSGPPPAKSGQNMIFLRHGGLRTSPSLQHPHFLPTS